MREGVIVVQGVAVSCSGCVCATREGNAGGGGSARRTRGVLWVEQGCGRHMGVESGASNRHGEFPHAYGGPIPFACLAAPPVLLTLDADGKHVFPLLGQAAVDDAILKSDAADVAERGMDDEDGYDGGAARGMYG